MLCIPARCGFRSNRKRDFLVDHQVNERSLVSPLLAVLIILLILFAIGGGVWVSNLLWLLLVVALIVLLFGFFTGRRAY
jgi:hypothetical protein